MARNRIVKGLAIGAAAVGLVAGAQGAASASVNYTATAVNVSTSPALPSSGINCVDVGGSGTACFQKYGDTFWVKDNAADGHHVTMVGKVNTTGDNFFCDDYAGQAAGWTNCAHLGGYIPEHAVIGFSVQVMEGNVSLAGSATVFISTT